MIVVVDRIKNLSDKLKGVSRTVEERMIGIDRQIKNVVSDVKYKYNQSYIRSTINELESELSSLSRDTSEVCGHMDKKANSLLIAIDKYLSAEERSKALFSKQYNFPFSTVNKDVRDEKLVAEINSWLATMGINAGSSDIIPAKADILIQI